MKQVMFASNDPHGNGTVLPPRAHPLADVGWRAPVRPWRARLSFLPEGRRIPDEAWRRRHRGLTWLLAAHAPVLFVFSLIREHSPTEALLQSLLLTLPVALACAPGLGRNVRSGATSLGLVIAASIFVHIAGGSIEAHFAFFAELALLTLYQSWSPFLLALVTLTGELALAIPLTRHRSCPPG